MTQNPDDGADLTSPRAHAPCPYCGAEETEPLALFGMQLLTTQMYCLRCHTPFEYVKDDAILEVFGARETREARKGDES